MRRIKLVAGWLIAVLLPVSGFALSLGDIRLDSALNQPFAAEIPLTIEDTATAAEVEVALASVETFDRYGLDRPAFLSDFSFAIQADSAGKGTISVSSTQPVAEPFVTLLLEIQWPAGRLLREYTVLLDPPVFDSSPVPTQVTPTQVDPVAPPAAAEEQPDSTSRTPLVYDFKTQPEEEAPTELVAEPEPAAEVVAVEAVPEEVEQPAEQPVTQSTATSSAPAVQQIQQGENFGPVQRNETLWGIARNMRDNSGVPIDLNQLMLALYRANPEAFAGNINILKEGAILRMPSTDDLATYTRGEAASEVSRQHEAWRARVAPARLKLVAPEESTAGSAQT
ncbi:MAG: type IV pilus assembly protein FimV, partial [Gammaproteobacteria bacterium]